MKEYCFDAIVGQTEFILSDNLLESDTVFVYINGIKKRYNRDFTKNNVGVVLTSALTEASDVDIVVTRIELSTGSFYAIDSEGNRIVTSGNSYIIFS